jgi:hypothetical protein
VAAGGGNDENLAPTRRRRCGPLLRVIASSTSWSPRFVAEPDVSAERDHRDLPAVPLRSRPASSGPKPIEKVLTATHQRAARNGPSRG